MGSGNEICQFLRILILTTRSILDSSYEADDCILSTRSLKPALTLKLPEAKIVEFANSVDLDEEAHNKPPLLDLHYFPSRL